MKEFGDKVLSKIENLITQIEKQKPGSKPSKTANKSVVVTKGKSSVLKEQTEVPKEQTALLPKKQNVSPGLDESVKNHNVSLTKSEHIATRQMSYGYIKREKQNLSKLTTKAYKVEHPFQTFKVTNKHSLWLLKQKKMKPIYDRLDQISRKKKVKLHLLQQEQEKEQNRSMVPCFSDRYTADEILKKYRKMNDEELKQFRQEYDEKNHERLKKLHCKQLNRIEKEVSEAIPTIWNNSRSLSKLRNIKKNYSVDVFKRLDQDQIDRKGRKKQLVNRVVEEEGGFQPVLCSKSRVLAEQSKSKHSFSTHEMNSHNKCKTPPVHSPFKKKIKKESPKPKQSLSPLPKQNVNEIPQKIDNSLNLKLPSKKHSQISKKSDKTTPKSNQRKSITPSKPQSDKNRLLNVLKDKDNISTSIKYDGFLEDGTKSPTKKSFKGDRSVPFDISKQQRHLYSDQLKPKCPYHGYKAKKDKSPTPSHHEDQPKWLKSSKK